ncbi:MNIO family bufferin maturase [Bdellovibrio bacteriovorus]|uniref:Uncharacterized protein n=1 Tax=Bdellovibrio bacteriovorus str. Tiberius TaxID=1069642 RepID=K7ZBW6_BDEBC|nr:DUF692 domain-containing protein [Bdellovibrio bacteriovorus]AFY02694.1 hypothetical protein Bdt_3019 [Bdellovibrio bacteriovorus str. Tiberius]
MQNSSFSHKVGMGLRAPHFPYLEQRPSTEVAWFEAQTETYIHTHGRSMEMLQTIRQDYPVALHGISMNIGAPEGIRVDYLQGLRELIDRVEPFIVSDHMSWNSISGQNFHNLLPIPFTEDSLQTLVNNIDFVQNFLRRALVLENISTYISYHHSHMNEWDFISEVSKRSGCALLLDVNNIYVNSRNHGFDPKYFINHIPLDRVAQIHLSGPSDYGDFLYDTHSQEIPSQVWDLFKMLAPQVRHLPVLIERDDDIPDFRELEVEVMKAAYILENSYETERTTESV